MGYTYNAEQRFTARKDTANCAQCKQKITGIAYKKTVVCFSETTGVFKDRYNVCAKCNHKQNTRNQRRSLREEKAKSGLCEMEDKQLHSWSDGSLTGGNCQWQCRACNINCTFGEIGSF